MRWLCKRACYSTTTFQRPERRNTCQQRKGHVHCSGKFHLPGPPQVGYNYYRPIPEGVSDTVAYMKDSNLVSLKSKSSGFHRQSGFIVGGYANLVTGYESESRRIVEDKYAEEWNASGLLHRFFLQRKMDREIAVLVAESMPKVSQEALF